MASTCYYFFLSLHIWPIRQLATGKYICRALKVAERQNSKKKDPSFHGAIYNTNFPTSELPVRSTSAILVASRLPLVQSTTDSLAVRTLHSSKGQICQRSVRDDHRNQGSNFCHAVIERYSVDQDVRHRIVLHLQQ